MPLISSTFPKLDRLQHLTLSGVKFLAPSLSGLTALRSVSITHVNNTSSDYSFPAHQMALHCKQLEKLQIGGYPASDSVGEHSHLSSSGLLLRQLHRSFERRLPQGYGWRLWKAVPLVITEFEDPLRIPNACRRPVMIVLAPAR